MPKFDDLSTNGRPEDSLVSGVNPAELSEPAPTPGDNESLRRVPGSLSAAEIAAGARRIIIRSSRRLIFLDTAEIDWIEASGNYVRFHAGMETYVARAGIGRVADRMNRAEFARIHRSTIVNLGKIKELEPCENGEYIVHLKDGKKLSCSRGYCGRLQEMIRKGSAF